MCAGSWGAWHGTVEAGPSWCQPPGLRLPLCPRTSSRGGCPSSTGSLSQQLREHQGPGSPERGQGGGWRGLEISQQTQHGMGRGDPPPSPFKLRGSLSQHCLPMEKTTVLITGCSSGIGLGLAARLAADAAHRFKGKGVTLHWGGPAPLGVSRARPGSTLPRTAGARGWAGAGAARAAWRHRCLWPCSLLQCTLPCVTWPRASGCWSA